MKNKVMKQNSLASAASTEKSYLVKHDTLVGL